MKAYRNLDVEFLVISTKDFHDLQTPILYIHSNTHLCKITDGNIRINHNQIDASLKLIYRYGGAVIYFSNIGNDIDTLLLNLNVKKISNDENQLMKVNNSIGIKGLNPFYNALGFILKDLKLSSINLINDNQKVIELIKSLNIGIKKQTDVVAFEYGKK